MIPWRRERLPTPVFLPGEFRGQRSLVGYSPWGGKESDATEQLTHWHIHPTEEGHVAWRSERIWPHCSMQELRFSPRAVRPPSCKGKKDWGSGTKSPGLGRFKKKLYHNHFFFPFIFISWRLITSQHFTGFCHTLTSISHGFTCISHPDPPLPPLSPPDPSGSSQCTRPEHLSHASNVGWWSVSP